MKPKQVQNQNRHKFLIEYFFDGITEGYDTRTIGNWVLVKQQSSGGWIVAIYPEKNFVKAQEMFKKFGDEK